MAHRHRNGRNGTRHVAQKPGFERLNSSAREVLSIAAKILSGSVSHWACGARLLYLPPYSPSFNPILIYSKQRLLGRDGGFEAARCIEENESDRQIVEAASEAFRSFGRLCGTPKASPNEASSSVSGSVHDMAPVQE